MSSSLRKEALSAFKRLHRTRLKTFQGDDHALKVTRQQINAEFNKNRDLADEEAIKECIRLAKEVEHEIRTTVIRVTEKSPGLFSAEITPDTVKVDNATFGAPFDKSQFRDSQKCCGGSPSKKIKK